MMRLGKQIGLTNLLDKYAERIHTKEGKIYYSFPGWFEIIPDDFHVVLHDKEYPEDLKKYIVDKELGR